MFDWLFDEADVLNKKFDVFFDSSITKRRFHSVISLSLTGNEESQRTSFTRFNTLNNKMYETDDTKRNDSQQKTFSSISP